ncbi:MAG: sigma-70 family RNA polymerase sigma factor [Altererythrobacter sp.]|nr:sigma-70 family RNA polymerase sigma factor [Altererythrobacter sp.]
MPTAGDSAHWVLEAVEAYELPLLRYARRLLDDLDLANDAVQHAFVKLCEQSQEQVEGRVAPWLFRVCRNKAIDHLRRAGREQTLLDDGSGSTAATAPAIAPDSREADPADLAEQHDLADLVGQLLIHLPAAQRETLDLWCGAGPSGADHAANPSPHPPAAGRALHHPTREAPMTTLPHNDGPEQGRNTQQPLTDDEQLLLTTAALDQLENGSAEQPAVDALLSEDVAEATRTFTDETQRLAAAAQESAQRETAALADDPFRQDLRRAVLAAIAAEGHPASPANGRYRRRLIGWLSIGSLATAALVMLAFLPITIYTLAPTNQDRRLAMQTDEPLVESAARKFTAPSASRCRFKRDTSAST